MKVLQFLLTICFFSLLIISCGTDTTANIDGDTPKAHQHDGHDHAGHDHSGHDHAGHDHSGHDHAGHDHAGHDHAGHNHNHSQIVPKDKIAQPIQDVEKLRARFEKAKKEPPTAGQKQTANNICECMKKQDVFSKVVNAKSQEQFDKAAGNDIKGVKALQACHNTIMPAAVKNLGQDAGIYSYKSRTVVNNECLGGNSNLWLLIGKFVAVNQKNTDIKHLAPKRNTTTAQ